MNSYKNYPLLYTYYYKILKMGYKKGNTVSLILSIFNWIRNTLGFGLIAISYLIIIKGISFYDFIQSILLFLYMFIISAIFYEIGYIHNDVFSVQKEKKPTIHLDKAWDKNYAHKQILYRIILGIMGVLILLFISQEIIKYFIIIEILTLIVFYIHNTIRNYYYNFITIILLRYLKVLIFVPIIYYLINSFYEPIYLYILSIFSLHLISQMTLLFNERFNGTNKFPYQLHYLYISITSILFYFFTHNEYSNIFIIFAIIYGILALLTTPKNLLYPINNR